MDSVSNEAPSSSIGAPQSITIIPNPDFEDLDFSKQLDPNNDWESEHPIFMTKIPEEMNEGLMALQDLKYGGSTPEEVADHCKDRGNEFFSKFVFLCFFGNPYHFYANFQSKIFHSIHLIDKHPYQMVLTLKFRRGKQFYKLAVEWYTKALAEQISDPLRTSIYLTNRAAVNLEMGNYGRVISDCVDAITANPSNLKAYFRAARASASLDKFEQALGYLEAGLKIDAKNPGLLKEKYDVEQNFARHSARVAAALKRKQKQEEERDKIMQRRGNWVKELAASGIALGPYLFESMGNYLSNGAKPYMDDQKELHWPVLFLYDEYHQMDFVQDFRSSDTIGDHLKIMFPGDSFCDWDAEKKYIHSKLEVFFVVNHVPAFMKKENAKSDGRPRKIKVNHGTTLRKVLEHPEYVIPGYPVFYIVVAGSKFKDEFLKRHIEVEEDR